MSGFTLDDWAPILARCTFLLFLATSRLNPETSPPPVSYPLIST